MDDVERGRGRDEALPWLEAVDDDDPAPALSARKMLAAVITVLIAAGLVAGTLFWLGRQQGSAGEGPPMLIAAPVGPYKVKPSDPGGLDVAGESGTSFATGAGEETDAELDLSAAPEEAMARPAPPPKAEPATEAPAGEQAVAEAQVPAVPSGAPGSTIQLGAYVNQAQAEAAWTALSKRFPTIGSFAKLVVPYQAAGSSGFRLRAGTGSPGAAVQACRTLKVAGENCFVVR
jgi:hypothetical protein